MRVLYAILCEDARSREDGRFDAEGVFHQLFAPGFPARQDRMTLAVALEWGEGEAGRREFRIDLEDPSGAPVLTVNGHTDVRERGQREPPPQTRLVLPLEDIVFPAEGSYDFVMEMEGERLPLAPLHLLEDDRAA